LIHYCKKKKTFYISYLQYVTLVM